MTEKELRKLNRTELLELFLEQCRRNEALEKELNEVKAKLESKEIKIAQSGSIAEASLNLTGIFEEAQKAADLYLANIKRIAGVEEKNADADDTPSDETETDATAAEAAAEPVEEQAVNTEPEATDTAEETK